MALDLHDKMQNPRHIVLSFDGATRRSGLGAAAWILWLRNEYGIFEKVSYGGCVLKNASAMIAEREALRKGIEHLTVLFPTVVSSFDYQVENSGGTVQYKLNAQSLRLFGLHSGVNDAHRARANRLQNKTSKIALENIIIDKVTTRSAPKVKMEIGMDAGADGEETFEEGNEKTSELAVQAVYKEQAKVDGTSHLCLSFSHALFFLRVSDNL